MLFNHLVKYFVQSLSDGNVNAIESANIQTILTEFQNENDVSFQKVIKKEDKFRSDLSSALICLRKDHLFARSIYEYANSDYILYGPENFYQLH